MKQDTQGRNLIQVKKPTSEGAPLRIVIGRHSHKSKRLQNFLQNLTHYNLTEVGSALKFCLIAEGLFDYYPRLGPCYEWDTAAGVCILQNAGGFVYDEVDNSLQYNRQESLISPKFFATNNAHKKVLII